MVPWSSLLADFLAKETEFWLVRTGPKLFETLLSFSQDLDPFDVTCTCVFEQL